MKLKNQLLQAIIFETILLILSTLLASSVLGHDVWETGALMLIISLMATLWNLFFNQIFDRFFPAPRIQRGIKIRILHAVAFEGGLLFLTLPLIMWWLQISLWQALVMDVGMTVFVLIYTFVFHWLYDHIQAHFRVKTFTKSH